MSENLAAAEVPRIWADWDQRDAAGRVWTFAADSDQPQRLRPGVRVDAGPPGDVRPAVVVDVLTEPWRTVVLLREVSAGAGAAG
ncbi:hypothetical protein SAMN05660209_03290 [Geodermatophilus africanus]|uniref:Uncharacterized protein n=1 Tax=Geodermatophilus africanus TaxID=1137993 RepID=A0A1H3LD34_9ACTN|nr:hypothetical protein [Geodermatophilus africanus]SDY62206.1 hypothetical protein SAMN05660209_03290 [Geodermatophilus africanus]